MSADRHSRDAAGSFTLNNPDDGTPITAMLSLGDYMYLVTERCTYRVQMADQVDPQRTNPTLPRVFQQKLFDLGTESELLRRTFIQAKVLFRKDFIPIDCDRALALALEAVADLSALNEICESFAAKEGEAIDKANSSPAKDFSQTIPSLSGVVSDAKNYAQKADHFATKLLNIVRLFFPELQKKNWDELKEFADHKYGKDDQFTQLIGQALPVLKLVRNTRDCLEHHLPDVIVRDFAPESNGEIWPPSIQVDFRGSVLDRFPLSSFMQKIRDHLVDAFEMFAVHLCVKSMKPFAGFQMSIGLLSNDVQASWHCQFAYGMYDQEGRFVPCG